jgi:hypothetical protein
MASAMLIATYNNTACCAEARSHSGINVEGWEHIKEVFSSCSAQEHTVKNPFLNKSCVIKKRVTAFLKDH